jgi:glycosyltransferase involved in cell wall biosynthesis
MTVPRLAHFVTHPIQYFTPLYRAITSLGEVELTVFFGSQHGVRPSYDRDFDKEICFDIPLLAGYRSVFLTNRGSGELDERMDSIDCPDAAAALAAGGFDAVWVHGWGYRAHRQVMAAASKLSLPYLMRAETPFMPGWKEWLRFQRRRWLFKRMLQRAAACLYVGALNRDFFRRVGVAETRLFPAYYSIEGERFAMAAAAADRTAVRRQYGVEPEHLLVAVAGKLVGRKRVYDVIRAAGLLPAQVRVLVIGAGKDRGSLEQLARAVASGRVSWAGFVNQSDMPATLAAADVAVLASGEEPWGLAVNEAMACGLPVVCSDRVGCVADLIQEGVTGYTYPVGRVEALADRIALFLVDRQKAARMGQAAQRLILNEYDVRSTARQIVTAVQAVVARRRAQPAASA